ncbi:MAG: alpha/beta fold hydrolase [Labilithrix sp.]|nr:alpha/beta fold hydrolase [Labilithrix sp.]
MHDATPSVETRARTFIAELARGEWTHPKTAFDAAMSSAVPADKLEALWRALEKDAGTFREVEGTQALEEGGYRVVHATCSFERGKKTLRLVFDRDDGLAGMFVRPPETAAWAAPSYAKTDSFEEREVEVGDAPALPGTLTVPKGAGPFPAIVLVHGSGPNDRDESIGGVKPFKDLAWGLASHGVAVLRYVKRSRHAPAGIVTQRDEVEAPARDAVDLLRRTPGIDSKRVFLLGHSQGGFLAPRIAAANPSLAGVVILAGSTRPLIDSLIDQLEYFATIKPADASLHALLVDARAFKQRVEAPGLAADEELVFPVGGKLTGAYFLDVRGYDPPAVAKKLACRVLVLQGERDYQVTAKDFDGWKTALGARPRATLRTYPSLNHLFVSGEGPPGPAEYEKPGHVDERVVADIAAWIAGKSP